MNVAASGFATHGVADKIKKTIDTIQIRENSVIVFDIDGTLIDTTNNPIFSIISTYHHAKKKGLKPIIITARSGYKENIEQTRNQLAKHGVKEYIEMYFLPINSPSSGLHQAKFKLSARKHIHERGMKVEISIGDMPWDIGQYGGVGFIVA